MVTEFLSSTFPLISCVRTLCVWICSLITSFQPSNELIQLWADRAICWQMLCLSTVSSRASNNSRSILNAGHRSVANGDAANKEAVGSRWTFRIEVQMLCPWACTSSLLSICPHCCLWPRFCGGKLKSLTEGQSWCLQGWCLQGLINQKHTTNAQMHLCSRRSASQRPPAHPGSCGFL